MSCKVTEKPFSEFYSNIFLERTINGPLKCSPTKPKEPERPATTKPDLPVQLPRDSKIVMAGNSNLSSAPSLCILLISAIVLRFGGI
jgi:hypothetical protein